MQNTYMNTSLAIQKLIPDALGFTLTPDEQIDKWWDQAPQPTAAELQAALTEILKDQRLDDIKTEAARRIDNIAPLWRQTNALIAIQSLSSTPDLTADQQQSLDQSTALFDKINTIRSQSDALEARAIAGEIFDPSDDAIWG
ncbi:MAG: hypothetical protein AB8B77_03625 [Alphaproteobacteria bacterium]